MSNVYFSYLFDAGAFYHTVSPLISELEAGHNRPLYELAKQTVEQHSEVWSLLEDFFLGPPFPEPSDEPSLAGLLTIVLARFLRRNPKIPTLRAWDYLKHALPLIGWSADDTRLVLFGQSLCTLLLPNQVYDWVDPINRSQDNLWCAGYANWLDLAAVERLQRQLTQSRESFLELVRDPRTVQEAIPAKTPDGQQLPLEWYSEILANAYEDILQILDIALDAAMPLAMTVQW